MTPLLVLLTLHSAYCLRVESRLEDTLGQYVDSFLKYYQPNKNIVDNDKIVVKDDEHSDKEAVTDVRTTQTETRKNNGDEKGLNSEVNSTNKGTRKGVSDMFEVRFRIMNSNSDKGNMSAEDSPVIGQGKIGRQAIRGHEYEISSYDPFPVWSYSGRTGFEFWSSVFPSCGGRSQSPINLDRSLAVHKDMPRLHFHRYDKVDSSTSRLQNNGRTLELEVGEVDEDTAVLMGGPLQGEYLLLQAHFHWGSTDGQGSEHTVDRHRFPLEMHLVHITSALGRGGSAVSPREVRDGLVVVAIHFQLADYSLPSLSAILDTVEYIRPAGEVTVPPFQGFQLTDLIEPVIHTGYFSYRGSLTTPGCNEVVQWLVMDETLPVSSYQLDRFRSLWDRDGESLADNFRPIQPLNQRRILYSEQWTSWR